MAWLRVVLLAILGLAVSLLDDWPGLTMISTVMLVLTVLLFVWSRFALHGLTFSRELPSRATVGDNITERLALINRSVVGKLFVEIEDRSTLAGHLANRVVSLGPRMVREFSVTSTVQQRGHHALGPVTLRSADPLGFFRRERRIPSVVEMVAYPLTVDLPGYVPAALLQSGGGTVHRRSQVPTAAVGGVRDYTSGDSINVISWTATARAGRLMVKEFEIDPTSDAWIVLDAASGPGVGTGARLDSPNPLDWLSDDLDYRVMLAASLSRRVMELGRSVGLLSNTDGTVLLPPERSDRQYIRIQEFLAVTTESSGTSLAELLTVVSPRFRPNSALLVITSQHDVNVAGVLASLRKRRISSELFVVQSSVLDSSSVQPFASQLQSAGIGMHELTRGDHPSSMLHGGGVVRPYARQSA